MRAATGFALKDRLVDAEKVRAIAGRIADAWSGFDAPAFERAVVERLPDLELKERVDHLAASLRDHLPDDVPTAIRIVLAGLPPALDPDRRDDDFGEFVHIAYSAFVALVGCSREHLELALDALRETTQRASAEMAVRDFLNAFPEETLAFLRDCSRDPHVHVRRLASEGTRPRLPWARKVDLQPRETLPLLDRLHADRARFVTRSVANHLNDLSRTDPDLVLERLRAWQALGKQTPEELAWLEGHALRTLIKNGHPGALELLGFGDAPELEDLTVATPTPVVVLGDVFELELSFTSRRPRPLLVDWVMDYAGSGGASGGRKVFKWTRLDPAAGERIRLRRSHPMRLMTTRALHEGEHVATVQVNGEPVGSTSFVLRFPED